jgi:SAM-dependent methyltransferase
VDLAGITSLELSWLNRVAISERDKYFDWQPADPAIFMQLLELCLPHVPPGNLTFLDAGCGIGTKCLLAAQSGLAAYGIDRVPEYLEEAARLGVDCELALAEDYQHYADFGLVYCNHPMVCGPGCEDEAVLEHYIHVQMAPGSVLMFANYDLAPGCSVHPQDRPCTDECPHEAAAWPQVARLGPWTAAWVKP